MKQDYKSALEALEAAVKEDMQARSSTQSELYHENKSLRKRIAELEAAVRDGQVSLYNFTNTRKFHIKDRGDVYSVKAPHEYQRDKCPFLYKDVLIDGSLFHVIGVESFAVCPTRRAAEIGLLVKERK